MYIEKTSLRISSIPSSDDDNRIPGISSSDDDKHDYASPACQTGSNGTLETYLEKT